MYSMDTPSGWGVALANHFGVHFDVLNRGFSGYTSRAASSILNYYFNPTIIDPVLITLFFGANDSNYNSNQFVSVEDYQHNLADIIQQLKNMFPKVQLLLISPPPVDPQNPKWSFGTGRDNETTILYVNAVQELSAELNLPWVNCYNLMIQHDNWRDFLVDGLHLSDKGNSLLGDELVNLLKSLNKFKKHALRRDFPKYSSIDLMNPDQDIQKFYDEV
eukprot:TRINITY_DN5879_c0_g1_i2.p2 TRINITY_DN5879_c0_g1~~TRINITY_DN5879_c0_g1_i2.p2  ORF type:complete len:245 (-),score=44.87 TRINITY_DN5879_c0_g1_i2:926-1579(-)